MLKEIPGAKGVMQEARLLCYDTETYPFAAVIGSLLDCAQLDKLHLYEFSKYRNDPCAKSRVFSFDHNMRLREKLKDIKDSHIFYRLFHQWVQREFRPLFQNKISYNSHPTFRVHMAGTPSVSAWHTDYEVTGRMDQVTVWTPLTDAYGTNTIHVETGYGKNDFTAVPVKYGEALLFDGNCLRHGSLPNTTKATRVSFDFRFAPKPELLQHFFKTRHERPVENENR